MSDDLSPIEAALASELSNLTADPQPASRAAIMHNVMAAIPAAPILRRFGHGRPLLVALAATMILVVLGSVEAFAVSGTALPRSPAYPLRLAGEEVRIAIATPQQREQLRIGFARDRFSQAQQVAHNDRSDAQLLLSDGRSYLTQARNDLASLSADEQGDVQQQLQQADQIQSQTQSEVDQQGQQGG